MIREIVRDEEFLSQKSEPATAEDKQIAIDLLDKSRTDIDELADLRKFEKSITQEEIA